jgi:TolA-binding protein
LEIQHREAWSHYQNKRYREALESFVVLTRDYAGNYLSPYWAGKAALQLGNKEAAITWFNAALQINPYYQPAREALNQVWDERAKATKSK